MSFPRLWFLMSLFALACSGCAEGPLWRIGQYTPWAQSQWAEEEKIANTQFLIKRQMTEMTQAAVNAPIEEQQRVAEKLAEKASTSQVLLLKLHAVNLLGQLDCPAAVDALSKASRDKNSDVRLAAIKAWGQMPAENAIPNLQAMLGSDTHIDVRLAATRGLANFSGQRAVQAISLALNDPDPALQSRAAKALGKVTGEQFGDDVPAWRQYVASLGGAVTPAEPNRLFR